MCISAINCVVGAICLKFRVVEGGAFITDTNLTASLWLKLIYFWDFTLLVTIAATIAKNSKQKNDSVEKYDQSTGYQVKPVW